MNVKDIIANKKFKLLTENGNIDKEIKNFFASDLLSFAMGNLQEGDALLTIISNKNVLAIASLINLSCIILTSNIIPDEKFLIKANEENIAVFQTQLDTARAIIELHEKI